MSQENKSNFKKFGNGIIIIEIQSLKPEKFINAMWKNNIYVRNIVRKNITTIVMNANLKDYYKIKSIADRTHSKMKVVGRKGLAFLVMRIKRRIALVIGIISFMGIIYYLSTFVWSVQVSVDKNLTPYEIRQQLASYGVHSGIRKKNINVYDIENKLIKNNDNIMWVRVRIEGSKLKVSAMERQSPPKVVNDDTPCNLAAKRDGEVLRVYTKAGTPVVKEGDIVKKGQLLVKGEQGAEDSTYPVHSVGDVICKTFYEEVKNVNINSVKRERTGNKIENVYFYLGKKKVYIKKSKNKFIKYDKIDCNKFFVHFETYYEVKETTIRNDTKKLVDDTANELYNKICLNLDKSIKVKDKIVNYKAQDTTYKVSVLVVAEENIASPDNIDSK
ncbi:sporulation protein YqfD [Clostridium sp. JN-1]|jgi:similar to stage IV sporulation protein|uniref:sporulation protein YqfD n=1 Tax=Clostridium sp. JN-1 TaxID=2483110 RepID=UPI000F0B7238|nr:sporulation protein YqfD [Clostridium sp. JN-1]